MHNPNGRHKLWRKKYMYIRTRAKSRTMSADKTALWNDDSCFRWPHHHHHRCPFTIVNACFWHIHNIVFLFLFFSPVLFSFSTVIWKFKPKNRAFIKLLQTTRLFKLSLFCIQFYMKYGSSYFSFITIFGLSSMFYACICYFLFMFRMHWALVNSLGVICFVGGRASGMALHHRYVCMNEEKDEAEAGEANGKNGICIWRKLKYAESVWLRKVSRNFQRLSNQT